MAGEACGDARALAKPVCLPAGTGHDSPALHAGVRASLRAAAQLARPFWMSERRYQAWALLAVLAGETVASAYMTVWLNAWNGRFMDALARYDAVALADIMGEFAILLATFVVLGVVAMLTGSMLQIVWRQWMTERFLDAWLGDSAFYRIERDQQVDNPDQRIVQDIDQFVTASCTLSVGLLSTLVRLVSFSLILWRLSGPLNMHVAHRVVSVPGYMLWAALIFASLTSCVTHWIGRPLMRLNFNKEGAEAHFRFMAASIREYAEQIALYRGASAEGRRMRASFDAIRGNFWQIVRFNLRFNPLTTAIIYISMIVPTFVVLPRYMAHAVTLGGMMRLSGSFAAVNGALSWFVQNYQALQGYRAIVARLDGLERAIASRQSQGAEDAGSIVCSVDTQRCLCAKQLTLRTPDGRVLTRDVNLAVHPAERWLIRGPSGVGKSTLIRALAGIWPYGSGQVTVPAGGGVLFLSQKNYVPAGTLKAALCYPGTDDAFDDDVCSNALTACRLERYAGSLYEVSRWGHRLSPGEQQRLAFARVLLQRPDFLLLDESTSALDPEMESGLYQTVIDRLPDMAMVSIAHHRGLDALHTHSLWIEQAHMASV
ncbi:ABC transporter family protein [Paraburkholderia xenovorans LB400]|uniref:ABC transporter, fused ATPase and inner membrane subunits n=2 Tax=Paraburkholderia xenovorans TaxID=36873 RepID=Q13G74_PARXL|nr:ABC transporter, fused ATPase and inner membrane subunits [Paraburkholderia xenovorans LB400]AIP33887.1 ABC transporter family protein [Paraburkholderia xenovorans LB400]